MSEEHATVTRADEYREAARIRSEIALARIADERGAELRREFRRRFPRRTLRALFGNGTELVEIDGRPFHLSSITDARGYFHLENPRTFRHLHVSEPRARRALQFIADAFEDIREICGHYSDACPNDIMSKPRKPRPAASRAW